MEAAGLEASLVSIKTCSDVWGSMANATRVSKEFDTIVVNVQIEMNKFPSMVPGHWSPPDGLSDRDWYISAANGLHCGLVHSVYFPPCILNGIQLIIGQLKENLNATAMLPRSNLSSDIPRTYHEVMRRMAHDTQMAIAQVLRLPEEVMDGETRPWKLENRAARKRPPRVTRHA